MQLLPAPKCGGESQPSAVREPWPYPAQRRPRNADELVLVADSVRGHMASGERANVLVVGAEKVSGSIS